MFRLAAVLSVSLTLLSLAHGDDPIVLGERLEMLVDDHLIEALDGAELQLHRPIAREVAIEHDAPWEGDTCAYHTVFRDGPIVRMYYRGSGTLEARPGRTHPEFVCYAESADGIRFEKPELGLVEFEGSTKNNILLAGLGAHDFAPFRDTNPACPPEARYKAIGRGGEAHGVPHGLYAFQSADAVHWKLISKQPIITKGAFDSQNLAFWDSFRGRYVAFFRGFREGVRDIMTCASPDFRNWEEPVWLDYPGAPREHLYTNQILPYARAAHLFLGFPKRFIPNRNPSGHRAGGISDGIFMTSRDGHSFHRWGEAIVRPGLQPERWVSRNNLTAWGIVETAGTLPGTPNELSIYSTENYYQNSPCRLRRFTFRTDGFVSVSAPLDEGRMLTRPVVFGPAGVAGRKARPIEMVMNYSTSAAGSVRCEILDADGKNLPDPLVSDAIFGDEIDRAVSFGGRTDLADLVGRPVRLRFHLADADLYSIQFRPVGGATTE